MRRETSIGGNASAFRSTLWAVVLQAKDHSQAALEKLIQIYWKPIYFFFRRKGIPVEDAKDLAQGFFGDLLRRDFLKGVAADKGRFRTFLLASAQNYLINDRERASAKKRGGGRPVISLDYLQAEQDYEASASTLETPERFFDRQWALETISQAYDDLAREMDPRVFEAIKPHLAKGPSYDETARALGVSLTQVTNLIHRTRTRFRECLRAEIAGQVPTPGQVDEELKILLDALKD